MNRKQLCKLCAVLLALVLLAAGISVVLAIDMHACCAPENCTPCSNLAKVQETLRQFAVALGSAMVFAAPLALIYFAASALLRMQGAFSLVDLKARLNS